MQKKVMRLFTANKHKVEKRNKIIDTKNWL